MYSLKDPNSQFSITTYFITYNRFSNPKLIFIFMALHIPHQIGRIQLF